MLINGGFLFSLEKSIIWWRRWLGDLEKKDIYISWIIEWIAYIYFWSNSFIKFFFVFRWIFGRCKREISCKGRLLKEFISWWRALKVIVVRVVVLILVSRIVIGVLVRVMSIPEIISCVYGLIFWRPISPHLAHIHFSWSIKQKISSFTVFTRFSYKSCFSLMPFVTIWSAYGRRTRSFLFFRRISIRIRLY